MRFIVDFIASNRALVVIFIVFFVFSMLTPMSGDDYTWASYYLSLESKGQLLESFSYLYQNLNGRIIGNGLEFFLINHVVLASLFKAFIFTGIVALVCKILKIKSKTSTYLTALLIAIPSIGIFRQVISWSAGFYNYVVPVFVLLVIYYTIQSRKLSTVGYILVAILAAVSALFMENMTIISLLAVSIWFVVGLFRKDFNRNILAVLIGLVLGAFIMFSSPVYTKVSMGEDNYRSLAGSGGGGFVSKIMTNTSDILNYLVYDLIHVYIAIFLVVIVINWSLASRLHVKRKGRTRSVSMGLMGGALGVLLIVRNLDVSLGVVPGYVFTLAISLVFAVFIFAFLVFVHTAAKSTKHRAVVVYLTLLSIGLVAPLLLITPFGYRNFFASYIVFLILVGFMLTSMTTSKTSKFIRNREVVWVNYSVASVAFAIVAMFISIKFIEIRNAYYAKNELDRGVSSLVIRRYPFEGLVHDPGSGHKYARFLGRYDCNYVICKTDRPIDIRYEKGLLPLN